jgi:hypothetical protein
MRWGTAGVLAIAAVLALSCHARAQRVPSDAADAVAARPATGGFEQLAPEQQVIARGLFLAQRVTSNGPAPLDLGEIAALKPGRTWPAVLVEMRGRGLVTAKTLQQVMGDYLRAINGCLTAPPRAEGTGTMVMVTANGRLFTAPRARSGDDGGRCAGDEDRRAKSLAEAGQ